MPSDLRYALRVLVRTPALTLPAVGSLALAIAVNTTMFGVLNAVLLRPIGADGEGDLVRIGRRDRDDQSFRSATLEEYRYLRDHASSFSGVMGYQIRSIAMAGPEGEQPTSAEFVTAGYFSMLGVPPRLGRNFGPPEDRPDAAPVVDRERSVLAPALRRRSCRRRSDPHYQQHALHDRRHRAARVRRARFPVSIPMSGCRRVWPESARPRRAGGDAASVMLVGRLKPGSRGRAARPSSTCWFDGCSSENPARDPDRGFVLGSARGAHPLLARLRRDVRAHADGDRRRRPPRGLREHREPAARARQRAARRTRHAAGARRRPKRASSASCSSRAASRVAAAPPGSRSVRRAGRPERFFADLRSDGRADFPQPCGRPSRTRRSRRR